MLYYQQEIRDALAGVFGFVFCGTVYLSEPMNDTVCCYDWHIGTAVALCSTHENVCFGLNISNSLQCGAAPAATIDAGTRNVASLYAKLPVAELRAPYAVYGAINLMPRCRSRAERGTVSICSSDGMIHACGRRHG